jgi:predicted secreted protein
MTMRGRSVVALGLLVSGHAFPAMAGDMASLNVLGYSPDGQVFAFEEYGFLDGSGGAYSNIYFIDIKADKFLPGTPFRAAEHEEGLLTKMRAETRARAEPLMAKYALAENPGVLVAYNPPSEIGSSPHKVHYYSYLSAQVPGYTYTLELEERELPPTDECLNMTGNYTGFTLRLTENQGSTFDKVLHADSAIPKSRGCPNQYRIGAVVSSERGDVPQIAMILVGSFGFEGNDQRWIAVPVLPYGP